MKTFFLIPVYFLLCLSTASAQEILSSAGEHYESTSGSASWTIGEPICQTLESDAGYVTQGFHQPSPIPTLSQWGIIICGFLLLIMGLVALRNACVIDTHINNDSRIIKSTTRKFITL